jgi:hypothetical protein
MSKLAALSWQLVKLNTVLKWRILEFRYLAHVANRKQTQLELLLQCVVYTFREAEPDLSGYSWHTQPLPGYAHKGSERTSSICWEGPICFTVYADDRAILGMAVEFRGSTVCIRQLQGAAGSSIPDRLKKWPALFVTAVKMFLLNEPSFRTIRLYSADTRPSYMHPVMPLTEEKFAKYQQQLRRRYDGTARQCGFKKSPHGKYWEWDLSMHKQ